MSTKKKQPIIQETKKSESNNKNTKPVKTQKATSKYSKEQVVSMVLNGKLGNGDARKRAIEKLGFNYKEIQGLISKRTEANTPKPSQPKVNNSSNTSNNNTTTKSSKPSTSQSETKPVSYPANSVTVGNHSITWVYWKNVTGSAWWEGSESAATSVQNAVDKEANHWVNVMTQDNLFSINGSNNLWVAAHSYNSPGKQIYHIPKEVIITDRHGVSATYTYIDRAKTYNYSGTGTYGSNDVFIQTSRPDGANILHYRLSKRLN